MFSIFTDLYHVHPKAHSIVSKTNWFKWVVVLMKVQSTNEYGDHILPKQGIWIFFKYWHYTLGICNTYIFDMIYADMLLLLLNCMVSVWLRRKKKIQTTKNACTLLDWTEIAWKTLNIFRFRKSLIDSRRFRGKDRVLLLLDYFKLHVKFPCFWQKRVYLYRDSSIFAVSISAIFDLKRFIILSYFPPL